MELAVAVPQVVAHRATRMALAGPIVSELDKKEFQRMMSEKQAAFARAYWDMGLQMFRLQLQWTSSLYRALSPPFSLSSASRAWGQTQRAWGAVLDKGLAPIHRTAVSNGRRLSKATLG